MRFRPPKNNREVNGVIPLMKKIVFCVLLCYVFTSSCGENEGPANDLTSIPYNPTSYQLTIPDHFPAMDIPPDNPMTQEGVTLGRRLFYDPILSRDQTMSCSSCHLPRGNFTDNEDFSVGVDGKSGSRSSMPLLNIGFNNNGFFWDGRVNSLEEQALLPVEDTIELHAMWPDVVTRIQLDQSYPRLFRKAFGIEQETDITKELIVKSIAQFERSLISSGQSKYDRVIAGEEVFTDQELLGHNIFFDIDPDVRRHAECGHCHNAPLFTTNEYSNNGIDDIDANSFTDAGRALVTGSVFDNGKFRVPTLRNIEHSAPYMHDGRFKSLDEVIDHYDQHVIFSKNVDPNLRVLNLSEADRAALIAFIKTLEDKDFLEDERYQSPF